MTAHHGTVAYRRPQRRSFTLTELLIVIALIALLVAILLAALSTVQNQAKKTTTLATMQAFKAACETFQQEHGYYPGVVPELVLANDPRITSTENALLHLLGGAVRQEDMTTAEYDSFVEPDWSQLTFNGSYRIKVNLKAIGQGPIIRGKSYAPYLTLNNRELAAIEGQEPPGGGPSEEISLDLPDLLDAWGQPILYMRRARPKGALTGTDHPQFYIDAIHGYVNADDATGLGRMGRKQRYDLNANPAGSIISSGGNPGPNLARILVHPALASTNTAGEITGQSRGAFMLLSAGPDGIYLSATDGIGETGTPEIDIADQEAKVVNEYDDVLLFGGE